MIYLEGDKYFVTTLYLRNISGIRWYNLQEFARMISRNYYCE